MNKLFNKIAVGIVSIAMAIGVGVAIGSNSTRTVRAAAEAHEHLFNSSTLPTGWTKSGMQFNSSYYKAKAGDYVELSASSMFDSGNVLSGNVSIDIACGTFGTWSNPKTATFTISFLNSTGSVLTTVNGTTDGLNSTGTTYRFSTPITLTAPTDVSAISKLRVAVKTLSSVSGSSYDNCLRFTKVKLTYDQTSSGGGTTYSVTYNANKPSGASGTVTEMPDPNPVTGISAGSYTPVSTLPLLDDYICIGWNIDSTATSPLPSITISEDTNLYAIWTPGKYLKFPFSSNPGSWPTTNSTTLTNYSYTLSGVSYTFALSNVKQNSGYLMLTKTAVLGLPAISGYKLTKVVAKNSGGCSTSVTVGVSSSSSSASYISGGSIQTWSTQNSSYTYTLADTTRNTMYYLYVTTANAQIVELDLSYEPAGATKLSAPTGLALSDSNGHVSWTAVSHASGYSVSVDNGSYTTEGVTIPGSGSPYFDASGLSAGVQHTISVKALGDGSDYTDSDPSSSYSFTLPIPQISSVSMSGSPASSESVDGGSELTMSATASTQYDYKGTLDTRVSWSVSPEGAVTFSKSISNSGENITVTATNNNYASVVITAISVQDSNKTASSNTFSIKKVYVVSSVLLSYTTAGGPNYDADNATSFDVDFTTSVNYTGDTGSNKVNITASPNTGVSGLADNVTAGAFTLTFTKSGTYKITSTSVENSAKSASVTISISNIFVPGYELITSTSNLRAGSKLIIASVDYEVVMSTTQNTNSRADLDYTISDSFIPSDDVTNSFEIITLENSGDGYWYLKTRADKYLYNDGTDNNRLKTRDNNSEYADQGKFLISFNSGDANIIPKVNEGRRIQYNDNAQSHCFSCYTGTQNNIQLFQLVDISPYFTINMVSTYIGIRGTQTISVTAHNGASANVGWSTSDSQYVSIPASSTGTSVVATGVEEGSSTITATFTPLDGNTYEALTCVVTVVEVDDYVSIGVTKFTKVTAEPSGGWEGTYLLVDETNNVCYDGSASPLGGDGTKSVSISSYEIVATASMINSSFNIKESSNSGYYNVRSNSGYYIGGTSGSINISIGEAYDVTISASGEIVGSDSSILKHIHTVSADYFRFYSSSPGGSTTLALYRADGERRAITDTIADWHDNAKASNYLVCDIGGTSSKINWTGLSSGSFFSALTTDDLDTLKRMTAKSAEDNGNYLEDFISDYDYLVEHKGYTDFLNRFATGGAMAGHSIYKPISIFSAEKTNAALIVVITSVITGLAIGGYFFLRKKKED